MNRKTIKSCYGIQWTDSGISSYWSGSLMKCYIWNNCILLTQCNNHGTIIRKEYVAPDGTYFLREHRLLAYLGIQVDKVPEEDEVVAEGLKEVTA